MNKKRLSSYDLKRIKLMLLAGIFLLLAQFVLFFVLFVFIVFSNAHFLIKILFTLIITLGFSFKSFQFLNKISEVLKE